MKSDWIQTFSGKKFFPLNPKMEDICIEDIAHSLSMQCRYNGHTKQFYSVAEHSFLMAQRYFLNRSDELAKYALLHDASEAYLSDIPRPLKQLPEFKFYRHAENKLQQMIYLAFGLSPIEPQEIKSADYAILGEEADWLMSPLHPEWSVRGTGMFKPECLTMRPEIAKRSFLNLFEAIEKREKFSKTEPEKSAV